MKKEIKILPMGASVTLTELNRLRKKANRDWKRFERLEKIHEENHTTESMDKSDDALDLWAESHVRFNEALTGRKRASIEASAPRYDQEDGIQRIENV